MLSRLGRLNKVVEDERGCLAVVANMCGSVGRMSTRLMVLLVATLLIACGSKDDAARDITRALAGDTNLNAANLGDANLGRANLTGTNLSDTNFTGANLTRALLTDAFLSGANLTDANLTGANLTGANLDHAILNGAILSEAILGTANLANLYCDTTTRWPTGVMPPTCLTR